MLNIKTDRYRESPTGSDVDYKFLDNGDFQFKRFHYGLTETCEKTNHA